MAVCPRRPQEAPTQPSLTPEASTAGANVLSDQTVDMRPRRRPFSLPDSPAASKSRFGSVRGHSVSKADWSAFLRRLERKGRILPRNGEAPLLLPDYVFRATWASFHLDGLHVDPAEVRDALDHVSEGPVPLRSRQAQRLRNHAAILHRIESDLLAKQLLTSDGVIRWYTAVSAGLSTTALDQAALTQIDDAVRRINSPQLRPQAAIREIASTHLRLLSDPVVPSFNGILARLLLRYHLGRCRLPAIVLDPAIDQRFNSVDTLIRRLFELLEQSYDELARS